MSAEQSAETPKQSPADRAEAILQQIVKAKGGSQRPGQTQMAQVIADSMANLTPTLLEGGTGIGKALDVDTLIPTPTGFRRMGSLRKGDYVFNEHGRTVQVTHAYRVMHGRPCYRVTFSDGSSIIADAEHLWDTITVAARRGNINGAQGPWEHAETVTTSAILDTLMSGVTANHHIPVAAPIHISDAPALPVQPYTVGVWLAAPRPRSVPGHHLIKLPKLAGMKLPGFEESDFSPGVFAPTDKTIAALQNLGLYDAPTDAAIPQGYIFQPVAKRRDLLAGVVDAGGVVSRPPRSRGQIRVTHTNMNLLDSLRTLLASLGIRATRNNGDPDAVANGKAAPRPPYVAFSPEWCPFVNATAKKERLGLDQPITLDYRAKRRAIVSVEPVESRPVRCITVDSPRHLYLAGESMIPTHNSIGYLAGALASGRQTVVAPHTKALQDQLVGDLELIASSYDANDPNSPLKRAPEYSVIKGRSSYLCLRKMNGAADDPDSSQGELLDVTGDAINTDTGEVTAPTSELGQEVKSLHEWANTTTTGDRSDLPFPVSGKAWSMVSTTADDCIGSKCPFAEDCYSERVRETAKEADIIVVNQAYLATAMKIGFLLPDTVEGVVVDEAHEFASVIGDVFGAVMSKRRIENALKTAKRVGENSKKAEDELAATLNDIKGFDKLPDPDGSDRALPETEKVRGLFAKLKTRFVALVEYAGYMPASNETEKAAKDTMKRMLSNIATDLQLIIDGNTDTQVVWADKSEYSGDVEYHAAQFDSSAVIFEHLLKEYKSVVFTSATLSIGGKMDLTAQRHGFGMENSPWRWQFVQSPFDYATQGRIFYPPNMPNPADRTPEGQAKYLTAVGETAARVAKAADGRTLMLCTSRASVNTIGEYLTTHLDQDKNPVFIQGPGTTPRQIAKAFADNPHAVLVGTRTFWTGVSVEGDTCAAVVIDKLPFPSPADPIVAARSEAADKIKAWEGFRTVSLADAILTMVQGVGRLIRTVNDRGVVVVCDPRIAPAGPHRKGYARDLAASLPPFTRAKDWAEVETFLADINATANDATTEVVMEDESEDSLSDL